MLIKTLKSPLPPLIATTATAVNLKIIRKWKILAKSLKTLPDNNSNFKTTKILRTYWKRKILTKKISKPPSPLPLRTTTATITNSTTHLSPKLLNREMSETPVSQFLFFLWVYTMYTYFLYFYRALCIPFTYFISFYVNSNTLCLSLHCLPHPSLRYQMKEIIIERHALDQALIDYSKFHFERKFRIVREMLYSCEVEKREITRKIGQNEWPYNKHNPID